MINKRARDIVADIANNCRARRVAIKRFLPQSGRSCAAAMLAGATTRDRSIDHGDRSSVSMRVSFNRRGVNAERSAPMKNRISRD